MSAPNDLVPLPRFRWLRRRHLNTSFEMRVLQQAFAERALFETQPDPPLIWLDVPEVSEAEVEAQTKRHPMYGVL